MFQGFGKGEITSFVGFIKSFRNYWNSSCNEEEQNEVLHGESMSLNEYHVAYLKNEELMVESHDEIFN